MSNSKGWLTRYLVTREGALGTKYLLFTTDSGEATKLFMKNKRNEMHTIRETLVHETQVAYVEYQPNRNEKASSV